MSKEREKREEARKTQRDEIQSLHKDLDKRILNELNNDQKLIYNKIIELQKEKMLDNRHDRDFGKRNEKRRDFNGKKDKRERYMPKHQKNFEGKGKFQDEEMQLERLDRALDLTDNQKAKIQPILENFSKKRQELREKQQANLRKTEKLCKIEIKNIQMKSIVN